MSKGPLWLQLVSNGLTGIRVGLQGPFANNRQIQKEPYPKEKKIQKFLLEVSFQRKLTITSNLLNDKTTLALINCRNVHIALQTDYLYHCIYVTKNCLSLPQSLPVLEVIKN